MDLAEAYYKKRTATQKIEELIVHSYSSKDGQDFNVSTLPGIGIHSVSEQGKFGLSLHIANNVDMHSIKILQKELNISDDLLDIQLTGIASAWGTNTKRRHPLSIGLSISHCESEQPTSGTIGCFVRKRDKPNELLILSCAHVLLSPKNWEVDSAQDSHSHKIVQPAICDGGREELHWVATFKEAAPLNFLPREQEQSYNYEDGKDPIDAAIAIVRPYKKPLINTCHLLNGKYRKIKDIINIISSISTSIESFPVFKIGKSTKLTIGKIKSFAVERPLVYKGFTYQGNEAVCSYTNLISIEGIGTKPFSRPGDSGALIFDEDGYAIALLIGGSPGGGKNKKGITYALPIETILNRLELEISA
jgi:hypothetical protein